MYPASFFCQQIDTNRTQIILLSQRGTKNENDNENYCHPDEELKLLPMLMPKKPLFSFKNI